MRMTRWGQAFALLCGLAALAWLGVWAWEALTLWRHDRACSLWSGPFLSCGPGHLAWQRPLLVSLMPLGLLGLGCTFRQILRSFRALAVSGRRT